MEKNLQFFADMLTYTKEILHRKHHFLCSVKMPYVVLIKVSVFVSQLNLFIVGNNDKFIHKYF